MSQVIETGNVSVNGQGHEGEDAGEPVRLTDGVRQLAHEPTERPVLIIGGVTEEGQGQDEEQVGEGQVPDVVVGHGFSPDAFVVRNDVYHQTVACDTEYKCEKVGGQHGLAQIKTTSWRVCRDIRRSHWWRIAHHGDVHCSSEQHKGLSQEDNSRCLIYSSPT